MNSVCSRNRLLMASLVLCSLALSTQATRAQAPAKAEKVVSVEGITEYKLDNGFRYLLFPDPSASTVTTNLTILVGSRHEGLGETGMAHLLEHMLFKGSKLYPHVDKALQAHGAAEANGTTWVDRTNYYEVMPGTDANLEFGIRFEADRLINCFIKREDLKSEMTVVRNEFERNENNPETILSERMLSAAYEWHNYGKTTMGNLSDIERVPIDKLQVFYRKYYQPDNAMLVIAGKFDEAKAHKYVGESFGAIPRPKRVLDATYTDEPDQDGERTVILRRAGTVRAVGVVYHVPAGVHPDYAAVEVMERVLLAEPAGRLYKALVETKKATTVDGGSYAWHDPGILEITARVGDTSTPEEVRDVIIQVMEKFAAKVATAEEVERAKQELKSYREQRLAKSKLIAIELSEWAGAGDWRLLFLHRDRVAKVTPADVDRVAKKYLLPSNRTVGLFIPTKKVDIARVEMPKTPAVADALKDFKGSQAIAEGEVFDPTPANIEARVKRTMLPSGVKTALLPKKTRGETVSARLMLRFGNEKSLTGQTTAAGLIGSLMMRGTKKYTRQEISDQLDKLGASMGVSSGTGTLSVSIQAKRKTLPAVLDLLNEVLRNPTFPPDEFDIIRAQVKQGLQKGLTEPGPLARESITRKLNPYPKDNIRYRPTIKESIARLEAVTRDQVAKVYAEQLGGTAGELVILGDFDPEGALQQMEKILAKWESSVPYERITAKANVTVPGSKERILTPDKKNAVYVAAYQLAMQDNAPDYPALEMGNYILGASGFTSLIMDRLRQKEGLSYGAGSGLFVDALDPYAVFSINATVNPKAIGEADAAVADVLAKALKDGITPTHFADAKKGYLEEQKVERANDGHLIGMLSSGLYLGRTFDYYAKLDERIGNLTLEEVNAALRRYVQPNRLVIVLAGDLKMAEDSKQK